MDYLKIWVSFRDIIKPLSDAEKGRLFDMMLNYTETGEEPSSFAGNERYLWPTAKQQIDLAANKVERLRENGSKGGRPASNNNQQKPNESNENQTKANGSNCNQAIANESLNVNVNDNVNVKDKSISVKRFTPPTVEEVSAYCKERGNKVDPEKFVAFYESKGWKVGNQPMKSWKASVITWEKDDRTRSLPQKTVAAQQYEQRDYDDEQEQAMARMLKGLGA